MFKKTIFISCLMLAGFIATAQQPSRDTLPANDSIALPDDIDYDELFNELSFFLDSLMAPKSYGLVSIAASTGRYEFSGRNNVLLESASALTLVPTLGYYHKDGLGLTATANLIKDEGKLLPYQYTFTPSFDYTRNLNWASGVSYTRYLTKDSLSFYTSPLVNEMFGYFSYRKWKLRPTVAVSYGWGSTTEYEEREDFITSLRLRRRGVTTISTTETVSDLSVITSLRRDFYWLQLLSPKDYIRFSPQINFVSGTQKFGFNQTYNSYAFRLGNKYVGQNTEHVELDDEVKFQPLAMSLFLRGEYAIGKMFLQPSFLLAYQFTNTERQWSTLFAVNAGVMF